jgi:hypothetical protein
MKAFQTPTSFGSNHIQYSSGCPALILTAMYPQNVPLHMYPYDPNLILSSQSYMRWHLTSLHNLYSHTTSRIKELDTTLADSSVTGKERKCIRARRSRALKAQRTYARQIESLNNSLVEAPFNVRQHELGGFAELGGLSLAQAAAIGGYFPPILQHIPPLPAHRTPFTESIFTGSESRSLSPSGASYLGDGSSGWATPSESTCTTQPGAGSPQANGQWDWMHVAVPLSEPLADGSMDPRQFPGFIIGSETLGLDGAGLLLAGSLLREQKENEINDLIDHEAGIIRLKGPEGEDDIIIMTEEGV